VTSAAPFLAALILLLVPADREATGPTPAASPGGEVSLDTLRARAAAAARSGDEGLASLVRQAGGPSAIARRAALEALGALPDGSAPEGTLVAALRALAAPDAGEREAATRALLACGEPARAALETLVAPPEAAPPAGLPAVPAARAADALADFRRLAIEREFLSLWTPEDGQFRGMYASLRARGPFGSLVLTAIALDRRVAGRDLLGYGPYAWVRDPGPDRERTELRERALTALEDAGDASSRLRLASILRTSGPAPEMFADFDLDPIPAGLDDAVRRTLASLGDPEPLLAMIRASEQGSLSQGPWTEAVEMRRRASAHGTLAESVPDAAAARWHHDRCVDLLEDSIRRKRKFGISVDGVEIYNLACARARRDDPGERDRRVALERLEEAVRTYAVSADWLARDGDLRTLHGEPGFAKVVAVLRARERELEDELKGR
jgi:hypothetical protein